MLTVIREALVGASFCAGGGGIEGQEIGLQELKQAYGHGLSRGKTLVVGGNPLKLQEGEKSSSCEEV